MSEQQVFEPLPCPFCGSHNVKPYEYLSGVEDAFCQCADCGSMGPSGKHATKDSAVAEWNQRAALPRPAPHGVAEVLALIDDYSKEHPAMILRSLIEQAITALVQERNALAIERDVLVDRVAELEGDVARYRWLTEDHSDPKTMEKCRELLYRMPVMSYASASYDIDAAMAASKEAP